ncbi:hypothetical protein XI04_03335 [Bradyrhizobium sp. CCBAU 11430]|uniref:YbfB/YjiJ family MFS transporter n=1 Tax=Bradyrhizobium sp. CCBAU 11430 TaxID=1630881 RepID=UPI002305405F|nr:YbfB/YjiJ family MFS transporter [Bradyrhizobium sp. CCBAU 11430]MDA9512105.1 hypothetical protein [Bradyrhizobium sp. CCBAU 11430]
MPSPALCLATGPSILFWNWVTRVTSLPLAMCLAYLTEATGVATSLAEHYGLATLLAASCVGATFMAKTSQSMVAARALWIGDLRRPVGIMTVAFGLGQIVGPALAGYLRDKTGGFLLPSLIAIACLLTGAVLICSARDTIERRDV